MAAWRNHRMAADLFDGLDERVRVVALIGDDRSGQAERFEQRPGLCDVSLLSSDEGKGEWIAQGVGGHVDFRAPAATRSAQRLRGRVFFGRRRHADGHEWAVLSRNTSSKSASWLTASRRRFQTPLRFQRTKRMYVVCPLPRSTGRSRHGAPVRKIHISFSEGDSTSSLGWSPLSADF